MRSKTQRLSTLEKGGLLEMARGRAEWYSAQLGYGFILPDDGGVELMVQRADIRGGDGFSSFENGAQVSYEPVWGEEGPEAKNVSAI
jgi:CspA family cold shock protein